MKRFLFACISTSVIFAGCSKGGDDPTPPPVTPVAKVMFVNGCVSSGTLQGSVNDTVIGSGIAYLSNSGYQSIANPKSSTKLKFLLDNSQVSLSETTMNLEVNKNYSVYASGIVTNPSIIALNDDLTAPTANKAKLRFIHLSTDNLNETIYVGSTKIDSNISYKGVSGFTEVAAGTYNIIVQDPNNVPQSKTLASQQLVAGKIYTIILTGTASGSGTAALTLTMINNN